MTEVVVGSCWISIWSKLSHRCLYCFHIQVPPTRARSPKLGRKKSSPPAGPEANSNKAHQSGRLSLDEKVRQNPAKGSMVHPKKPQRKSLPTLPSEKTSLSKATNGRKSSPSKADEEKTAVVYAKNKEKTTNGNEEQTMLSNTTSEAGHFPTQEEEEAQKADPSRSQLHADDNRVVEEQSQPTLVRGALSS